MDDLLQTCDECGKGVKKFHRRYLNKRYCQECYRFLFRQVTCPGCGELARLHTDFPLSVCNKCEKAKPCVRCGRTGYRLGKLTPYGPVCNACSYWFREARLCSQCGRASRLLSYSSESGYDEQICPSCARTGHQCCSACRRYRKLSGSSDGRQLCQRCLKLGEIKCGNCGTLMPAGYGKICEECHCHSIFLRHCQANLALFPDSAVAGEYRDFCRWLGKRQSHRKCGALADRYCLIFLRIGNSSDQFSDWHALFRGLSPGELRRFPLLEQWLCQKGSGMSLRTLKQPSAEEHYIKNILARSDGLEAGNTLRQYAGILEQRWLGGTQLRTTRLALGAAVALLEFSTGSEKGIPVQRDVLRYLRQKPGQRGNLYSFIHFLNAIFNAGLVVPKKKAAPGNNRKRQLEKVLLAMICKINQFNEMQWVRVAIAYFHDVSLTQADALLSKGMLAHEDRGYSLRVAEKTFWIPEPVFKSTLNLPGI